MAEQSNYFVRDGEAHTSKQPITYCPSPLVWTNGLFQNLLFIGIGFYVILFLPAEIVVLLWGIFFLTLGVIGISWEILLAKGYFISLDISSEGIDYSGFWFEFFVPWGNIKEVDIRIARYWLPLYYLRCVVIEKMDGTRKTFPLYFFKKQDLSQLFRIIRAENASVHFTQNVLDRLRIWG